MTFTHFQIMRQEVTEEELKTCSVESVTDILRKLLAVDFRQEETEAEKTLEMTELAKESIKKLKTLVDTEHGKTQKITENV